MQQRRLRRGRAALTAGITLSALLAGQQQAHAWAGYGDAPTTHPGITFSEANPPAGTFTPVTPATPRATLVDAINNSSKPRIVVFQDGTYRIGNINITRRDVTLRAANGATVWFDGSVSVPASAWTRDGTSNRWSTDTTPTGAQPNAGSVFEFPPLSSPENVANTANGTNPLADDGEMAFLGVNGAPQVQVALTQKNALAPGQFCVDRANDKLYVYSATAPANASLARLDTALVIDATDVTLRGLNFRRFVGLSDPVGSNPGSAVDYNLNGGHVDRCVFFWNAHGGLDLNARMIVERSQFVSNGWNGIGTNSSNTQIRGNYIAYNNVEGFNTSWSGAGIKLGAFGFTENLDLYDNEICHNRAAGVWFDGESNNVRVFRNYIHDNVSNEGNPTTGIFFEISSNCTAAFNLISGGGAGINIAATPDVKVYNNTFFDNKQHLYVNDQTGRGVPERRLVRTQVVNNIFMAGGTPAIDAHKGGPFGGEGGAPAPSKNRFSTLNFNVYRDTPGSIFKWRLTTGSAETFYNSLAAFRAAPDSATADFEAQGRERTVGSVFVSAAGRDFRVPGSDTDVAHDGAFLPNITDGLAGDIRGLLRDEIPFVDDALTNARCDLAAISIDSLGNVPNAGQYRGAFKPTNRQPRAILTAPVDSSRTVGAPASITLAATAEDDDGNATIDRVEFYRNGTTLLGTDSDGSNGWGFTLSNAARGTYLLSARAVDNDGAGGTSATVSHTVYERTSGINAGDPAVDSFAADTGFSGGRTYAAPTPPAVTTTGVANPAPIAVYQSERYGTSGFTYTLSDLAAGGNYTVRLHFAETIRTAAGQRDFGVNLNGGAVELTNFDIFAEAGGADKALVREFDATPDAQNQIVIEFLVGSVDAPKINGIELYRR